jgi:hypothetical protein
MTARCICGSAPNVPNTGATPNSAGARRKLLQSVHGDLPGAMLQGGIGKALQKRRQLNQESLSPKKKSLPILRISGPSV